MQDVVKGKIKRAEKFEYPTCLRKKRSQQG